MKGSFSVVYDENRARKCAVYIREDVVSITADYVRNVNDASRMRRRTITDIVNASCDCRMRQYEHGFLSFSEHVPLDSHTLTVSWPRGTINNERPPLHVHFFSLRLEDHQLIKDNALERHFSQKQTMTRSIKQIKQFQFTENLFHMFSSNGRRNVHRRSERPFNHLSTLKDPICIRTEFSHGDGATHDSIRRWSSVGVCLCNRLSRVEVGLGPDPCCASTFSVFHHRKCNRLMFFG
jgi:hypothetical protein